MARPLLSRIVDHLPQAIDLATRAIRAAGQAQGDPARSRGTRSSTPSDAGRGGRPAAAGTTAPGGTGPGGTGPGGTGRPGSDYPGDYRGVPTMTFSPHPDGVADPGEVVWAWVPYEEDHSRGKDRPVLVIGRDGAWLLALQLTSKDHDRDAGQERRAGRVWMDVGSGPWDRAERPSEVRLNRILRLDPAAVRREGAALPRGTFDQVADGVRSACR